MKKVFVIGAIIATFCGSHLLAMEERELLGETITKVTVERNTEGWSLQADERLSALQRYIAQFNSLRQSPQCYNPRWSCGTVTVTENEEAYYGNMLRGSNLENNSEKMR